MVVAVRMATAARSPPHLPVPSRRPPTMLAGERDGQELLSVVEAANRATRKLRGQIEEAEDDLRVEVEHTKKFMWRGKGLRHDFVSARAPRQLALLRGAAANEKALVGAMEAALAAGLPRQYMEDALRVANSLAVVRAEMERDYIAQRTGSAEPGHGDASAGDG